MNLNEIKSITLSLMKKESDINENKADYTRHGKATFKIPQDFFNSDDSEKLLEDIIEAMFDDITQKNVWSEVDYLGIWIESIDDHIIENAMSLKNLESIKEYSTQNINPIFEFFKMTLDNNG
jgi:hypothetical protein